MSENIKSLSNYQHGNSIISGDFLVSTKSPIICFKNTSTPSAKAPPLIDEPIPALVPCITLDFSALDYNLPCDDANHGCDYNFEQTGFVSSNLPEGVFTVTFHVSGEIVLSDSYDNPGEYVSEYVRKNPYNMLKNNKSVYTLNIGNDVYVLNYGTPATPPNYNIVDYTFSIPIAANTYYTLSAFTVKTQ